MWGKLTHLHAVVSNLTLLLLLLLLLSSANDFATATFPQQVWEKLTNYMEIEPRWVPNRPGNFMASTEDLVAACDENTIGGDNAGHVVAMVQLCTFRGCFHGIEALEQHSTTSQCANRQLACCFHWVIVQDGHKPTQATFTMLQLDAALEQANTQ